MNSAPEAITSIKIVHGQGTWRPGIRGKHILDFAWICPACSQRHESCVSLFHEDVPNVFVIPDCQAQNSTCKAVVNVRLKK